MEKSSQKKAPESWFLEKIVNICYKPLMAATERPAFIGTFNSRAHRFLVDSSLTFVADIAKDSHQKRVEAVGNFFGKLSHKDQRKVQGAWVIDDFPELFIDSAKQLMEDPNGSALPKKILSKVTVVKLDASEHSVRRDEKTGIRILNIKEGETPFPRHPTPDS